MELNPPPTLADMEGARHLRSGAFTPPHHHRRQLLLLRVVSLVVLAGCGNGSSAQDTTNTRIDRSPRLASPQAKRMILIFDRHETGEGRLESLRGVRDDGYTCWFFPWTFSAAVCLQVLTVVVAGYSQGQGFFVFWLLLVEFLGEKAEKRMYKLCVPAADKPQKDRVTLSVNISTVNNIILN